MSYVDIKETTAKRVKASKSQIYNSAFVKFNSASHYNPLVKAKPFKVNANP